MFERFNDQAREVCVGARQEARKLKHYHIGTEHLLLALLDPASGVPYTVLHDAGWDRTRVRADIERVVAFGEGDAAALRAIGIDLHAIRAKIEESFGPGALEPMPPSRCGPLRRVRESHVPFTPRAKKVLELALREALALRCTYIGTEHILLGLLREGEGLAAKILTDAGVSLDDLRTSTIAALRRAA